MEIRIHTKAGSVESFFQRDPALAAQILHGTRPANIFAADHITIAGDYSLTVFATSRINRIDFITEEFDPWDFPADILDMVELSEAEFRQRSHLKDPARLEKRTNPRQPGECAVVFLDVELAGGERIFLAAEIMVSLPAERLQRLHLLFSAPALHCRLLHGGTAVLNLGNLVRFTLYPGPDHAPDKAWPAHHLSPS